MTIQDVDWYDTPLYYDIIFDADTKDEADFLEGLHQKYGTASDKPTNLELACGTGRVMRELASRGWKSAGFDASESMLEFAWLRFKQERLKSLLWQDKMESFRVPTGKKFDLVHCLVSTFKYIPSETRANSCLSNSASVLKEGGLLVIGLHLTDYNRDRVTHERWVERRGGIEVVCNTRTWPPDRRSRTESIRSRLKITHTDGMIQNQETHWTGRTYSASQLKSLINSVPGLTLISCHDFNHDVETTRELDDSYADIVVVLRKTLDLGNNDAETVRATGTS